MNNLEQIAKMANEKLGQNYFFVEDGKRVMNGINRVEGNDIDVTEEDGTFLYRITGHSETLSTVEECVDFLVEMAEGWKE
ncbi:MAG TPA: hypothetical protein VGF79_10775 [Bacteroidia bacterium]